MRNGKEPAVVLLEFVKASSGLISVRADEIVAVTHCRGDDTRCIALVGRGHATGVYLMHSYEYVVARLQAALGARVERFDGDTSVVVDEEHESFHRTAELLA